MAQSGHLVVDTGIQFVILPTLCAKFNPHPDSFKVNVSIHSGVLGQNTSANLKLLLRNDSKDEVRYKAGSMLMQAFILPIIYPTLAHKSKANPKSLRDGKGRDKAPSKEAATPTVSSLQQEDDTEPGNRDELDSSAISSSYGSLGKSDPIQRIELLCLPTSNIHMMMDDKFPTCLQVSEINSVITLPHEDECRMSIIADVAMSQT